MINNIQALRAFAALSVVLFHVIGAAESYGMSTRALAVFEGWGRSGVDVFFVISGYIMVISQGRSRRSPSGFFANRLARIVPVYWLLSALLTAILLTAPGLFREMVPDLSHIASSFVFLSQPLTDRHPLLYLGWTLEFEFLFYAIFALAIWAGNMRGTVLVTAATLCALHFGLGVNAIVFEFVFGMVIALFAGNLRFSRRVFALIGLAGAGLLFATLAWDYVDSWRALIWGVPALLLVLGFGHSAQTGNRLLLALGACSYSIYLVQVFTIPAVYKIYGALGMSGLPPDLLAVGCMVLTAVAGWVLYIAFERPATRMLRRPAG